MSGLNWPITFILHFQISSDVDSDPLGLKEATAGERDLSYRPTEQSIQSFMAESKINYE